MLSACSPGLRPPPEARRRTAVFFAAQSFSVPGEEPPDDAA
jgi:hypothetical protein